MDTSGNLWIWDFNGNRLVKWDDRKLECPVYTSSAPTKVEVTWEERLVVNKYHGVCLLTTTDEVQLLLIYGQGIYTNCDDPEQFKKLSYVSGDLVIPAGQEDQGCIEYFKYLGLLPGRSLDYARKAICDPDTYPSHTLPARTTAPTMTEAVRDEETWEDRVSYSRKEDSCELMITDDIKILVIYNENTWAICGHQYEKVNNLPSNLTIAGEHSKQWCIKYFKILLGFHPEESLDYAKWVICTAVA